MKHWFVGDVDITRLCEDAEWHLATAYDAAKAAGLDEAFVDFVFSDKAENDDVDAGELVTDEQWDALEFREVKD